MYYYILIFRQQDVLAQIIPAAGNNDAEIIPAALGSNSEQGRGGTTPLSTSTSSSSVEPCSAGVMEGRAESDAEPTAAVVPESNAGITTSIKYTDADTDYLLYDYRRHYLLYYQGRVAARQHRCQRRALRPR